MPLVPWHAPGMRLACPWHGPDMGLTWQVLKREGEKGFHPELPPFGFGDPLSYRCIERAVKHVSHTGAVRHGAECFNYYFPQVDLPKS